jgi:hypothetical protein
MLGRVLAKAEALELGERFVPYLLTLTVKDGPDLRERFEHLRKAVSDLVASRRKKGGRYSPIGSVQAGFGSIEIVRGKGSGLWHVHMHALVFSEGPLPVVPDGTGAWRFDALSEWWHKRTGDSFIVECHPVVGSWSPEARESPESDELSLADPGAASGELSPLGAICEVCKYAVKLGSLSPEDRLLVWRCMAGRRLVSSFGLLRGKLVDDEAPDLGSLAVFMEWWYRYCHGHYRLVRLVQHGLQVIA